MNPMRKAAAKHAAAVAGVKGERLRIEPQAEGGRMVGGGPDTSRPFPDPVIGTVARRSSLARPVGEGAMAAANVRLSDAAWVIGFEAALALNLRAGDHVVRLDDPPPGEPVRFRLQLAQPIPGRALYPAEEIAP